MKDLMKEPFDYEQMESKAARTTEMTEPDHLGFRAKNDSDYAAICQSLRRAGLLGSESRAEGHTRTFFELGHGLRLEVQLWDEGLPQRDVQVVHVDIRSSNPMATLKRVSPEAEDWGEGEVPRGGARVTPYFMVMARPSTTS